MASDSAPQLQFSSSEVNLLIYHYLKESGFLHTCFSLRYEARLDDLPAAHEAVVQPGQLLHYLQRGLMYATAERHVQERADASLPPMPDPLVAVPDGSVPRPPSASMRAGLTPPPAAPPQPERKQDAASQTTELVPIEKRSKEDVMDTTPPTADEDEAKDDSPRRNKKAKKGSHATSASRSNLPGTKTKAIPGAAHVLYDKNLTLLSGHAAEVFVSDWNPAVPGLLASGGGDATVRIWDLNAPSEPPAVCKHLPPTQAKNISTVAWNPDGTLLASGSHDGILRLWTPQGDLHLVMSMHQGPIFAVRWNAKGNLLLTGSADGTAIVWDVGSGRTRQQFSLHSDNVLDVQWLTGALDMPPKAPRVAHPDQAVADAIFATGSADNSVHLCKLGEPKPIHTFHGHTDEVNAIRFDPSQTLLASASDDTTAKIWAVRVPGVQAPRQDGDASRPLKSLLLTLTGHTKEVYSLAWCSTGPQSAHPEQPRMLATCSFDHSARLWNGDNGDCLRVIDGHTQNVYALCFSPCARYLATGGIDDKALVTRIADGQTMYEYAAGGAVLDLAWNVERTTPKSEEQATQPSDARAPPQRLAVAQADKLLGVVDLTPYLM